MKIFQFIVRRLAPLALVGALSITPAAAAEKVSISALTWDGARAIAYVIKAVVELRLDGEAEIKQADPAVTWAALDKGDGGIDIYPDVWMPNHQESWDKYVGGRGTIDHNNRPYAGSQQVYVPTYAVESLGVRSVEDLKDPNIAAEFDSDGNGLGELYAGQAGWNSTKMWQVKLRSYGLDEWWEATIYDHGIFRTQLDGAYKKKDPLLFYLWTPEWTHAAYDLTALNEPARTDGCENMLDAKERDDWLEASNFSCASNPAEVWVAFTKKLYDRAPKTAKFLKQLQLDPAVISQWILRIGRDKEDPQDVAEEWVEANPAIVDRWVAGI